MQGWELQAAVQVAGGGWTMDVTERVEGEGYLKWSLEGGGYHQHGKQHTFVTVGMAWAFFIIEN